MSADGDGRLAFALPGRVLHRDRLRGGQPRLPTLGTQWLVCGLAYGVIAYAVMTWFVVAMSNAGNGTINFALPVTAVMLNGVLIHAFGVGPPAAYFASRVRAD